MKFVLPALEEQCNTNKIRKLTQKQNVNQDNQYDSFERDIDNSIDLNDILVKANDGSSYMKIQENI